MMKIGFYSTMRGIPWGASEYLWSEAALVLQQRGYTVGVNYKSWKPRPKRLQEIAAQGGSVFWRESALDYVKIPFDLVRNKIGGVSLYQRRHIEWLEKFTPDFVLISVSGHLDDLGFAKVAAQKEIPYAMLLHCASPHKWIESDRLNDFRNAYSNAQCCFFVSQENCEIIETHLGMKIACSRVVDNPLKVCISEVLPWQFDATWHIACVARLACEQKGQDLILEVLRQPKWRSRPIQVTFWGRDFGNQQQIEDLIQLYGLQEQVRFGGFTSRPEEIWQQAHALVLPSRYEGMPMVTAEAMLCGRIPIVTSCGRNSEWVDEGETGFIVAAPIVELLDAAMERAWSCRHRWQTMGQLAAKRIRQRYSNDPAEDFAIELENLAQNGGRRLSSNTEQF